MAHRISFIISTSVEYFGVAKTGSEEDVVRKFIEEEDLKLLAVFREGNKIKLQYNIPTADDCLLFYKIPNGNINSNSENLQLGILTLQGGMVKPIHNSVQHDFSNHSAVNAHSDYNSVLSCLLENLHTSLGTTLDFMPNGIRSLQHEINYWKQKSSHKSSSRVDREMSQTFIELLEAIDEQMINMEANLDDFFDQTHKNLDKLWSLPYKYPMDRMILIFDIIGNRLLDICIDWLSDIDIWNSASSNVNHVYSHCMDTVDSWMQMCDSLTRLFWPNYVQNAWLGEPYIPKRIQLFRDRLGDINSIKNLIKQILTLLQDDEVREIFVSASPFREINVFDVSTVGQSKWNKALQYFEQMLQPIDERIALALKQQIHNHLSNARQVIYLFSMYETLIQRPAVLELLIIEREQFLQSLQVLLNELRKAMTDNNMEPDTGHLSVVCNECRWLKIVQHQINEIEKVSHLISGQNGYDKVMKAVQEIREDTDSLLRTNFDIWCGQCSTDVNTGQLKLRDNQPVVKFEKEGRQLMRVTFNPKLVTFCQDVREFENIGFSVPSHLQAAATHALKFISFARQLQQVSTFHNTIGDRMIPCQRPIMLKNAMELSKLVQSEIVAWNDQDSVYRYVNNLQTAVSKLSADNTILVGYHEQAKKTVAKLMDVDLFAHTQVWKDEIRHLRDLVASLEKQGFMNLDAFKLHWDHQLYKVLEYQYIVGLVDMNNKLSYIHVDIVFRQKLISFKPTEEELRDRYFTELNRFIDRPSSFRGLSDKSADIFKTMIAKNSHNFGVLFRKSEELFERIQKFKRLWLPWVALGCVDADELCSIYLSKPEDWDYNFRSCKTFSQKIAKLQTHEESIDCIVVNIQMLRSDIEFISRRYWESLTNSLRNSIVNDISVIQDFLHTSLKFLQNVPIDESSLTESSLKYEKFMSELPEISETLDMLKGKDTCLAGWCKERVPSLVNIYVQWEKLQPLVKNHAVVLQRQIDIIKEQANTQIYNLHNEAEKLYLRWESTMKELEANEHATLDMFKERQRHWQQIIDQKHKLLMECETFNMKFPQDVVEYFEQIEEQVKAQSAPWLIYENYLNELHNITREEWTIYSKRPYVLQEFITKWEQNVMSCIDLPAMRIRQHVDSLKSIAPILQSLQSNALTERHWSRIFMLLNMQPKPVHNLLLSEVMSDRNALLKAANEIAHVSKQAASEHIVKQALTELDQWSVMATFKLISHKTCNNEHVSLVKNYQEMLNKIGDNQALLQSVKNSTVFDTFADQAELWQSRLSALDQLMTSLNHSQRRWVYLEPVFGAGTFKNEAGIIFNRVDNDFRFVMREIQVDSRVTSLLKINNINSIVNMLEVQLARCQNNLMSYLMEKRNCFPRFYFLGDDDLLEILGQAATDPNVLQKHAKKLFPGCHKLQVLEKSATHYAIISVQNSNDDLLKFDEPVLMTADVEKSLNSLLFAMQHTLRNKMVACCQVTANVNGFDEKILGLYPMQVLCTVRAINFTKQVEKCLTSFSLADLNKSLTSEITQYATLKQKTNDKLLETKLRALLLDLVHYATIVEQLLEKNVANITDWHWFSQLRFYLDNEQIIIRMAYAEFEYSYEFLATQNNMVNTSLTHKCYLILTQAKHMGLGGNPFGPAGTGKTECVKALGALLGRLVLVFNCDENVDAESMELILIGLGRCGAWGCFDEFNRLLEGTLSVISMLIQPIQNALKEKTFVAKLGGREIKLNHHCGIFVTLNPAGTEYGGRQQLPGNIQALFRPIVMQQPEPREIARVILFVEGFQQAADIAERIVELYTLCCKMLSPQRHYDWGLRELKSVLLACGEALQQVKAMNTQITAIEELSVVMHCLRSSTISKLSVPDVLSFGMLLQSVFPEIEFQISPKVSLEAALTNAFPLLGLCANEMQITKAIQLHDKLMKRMGVVVVGPPGCGKSSIIALLQQAMEQLRVHTISPKSMSRIQLLGQLNEDTRQWQDGVLTHTAVIVNEEPAHIHSWIVCDGSIDPDWIEALNSVLDDNKLLTLPSGWRIQFGNNVNFIFETDDLLHASPATISRMGIINMGHENFPQQEILNFQLNNLENGDLLNSYIKQHFLPAVHWIEQQNLLNLPAIGKSSLYRALLLQIANTNVNSSDEFCLLTCGTLCGFLPVERHNEFIRFVFNQANISLSNAHLAEFAYFDRNRGAIDYYTDDFNVKLSGSLIFTAAVQRYLATIDTFLKAQQTMPFMLVGPSGSAKTIILQHAVNNNGFDMITINCSTQLTSNSIIQHLKKHCIIVNGARGREYRPHRSRLVLFLRNLHLCQLDVWGNSEVVEMLLQLIQLKGFYTSNLEWINISGLQICSSISTGTHINSSYNDDEMQSSHTLLLKITPRFISLNQFLRVATTTDADMTSVVQSCVKLNLEKRFQTNSFHIPANLVKGLIEFFKKLQVSFLPTIYAHYQFSPKLLMEILNKMAYYPHQHFNEALYCELNSTFKSRLATQQDVQTYEAIVKQSLHELSNKKENAYFVPTDAKREVEFYYLSHDKWLDLLQKQLIICSAENVQIDKPITMELLDLTAQISRALTRADKHILIIGQAGGRQLDALYAAATMQQVKVLLPQGSTNYGLAEFYSDMKSAIQAAALENQSNCLLIEHCWISYAPDIMKPIEALLEKSEIIDLFGDDLESLASKLKPQAQLEGYQESMSSYFMKRAKENFQIVICLDAANVNLGDLLKKYPALYANTELIYVRDVSNEMLKLLPKAYMAMLNKMSSDEHAVPVSSYFTPDLIDDVIPIQPPKRYYQLISSYYHIYKKLSTDISERLKKLKHGVDKLNAAHTLVETLKSEAGEQEIALAEKRQLAKGALEMISATMRNANEQKSNMLELKKQTQVNSEQLKQRQKEIEVELSEVEPILAEASAAVGQIKAEALSEIRSLRAPPEAIRDILEGVLRLMGIRDTSWNSMKTFLAKRGVKEDIRLLNPARINAEHCEAVEKLLVNKADSFEMRNAKRASAAAAPLAAWVKASVRYARVMHSIKPLEREQNELKVNLNAAENELESLKSELDDVDTRVKELSVKLNAYTQEAAVLELKLQDARATLLASEVLVQKLNAEFQTWNKQLDDFKLSYKTLDKKSLIIALSINYFSHLMLEKRVEIMTKLCHHLQMPTSYNLRNNLLTDQEQIIWESMGLARDAQIIEEAAFLRKMLELPYGSYPIPLLIDPTESALPWLEKYLQAQNIGCELTTQNNERLSYTIELAVRFGTVLVVQDCEDLRPPLLQMLGQRVHIKFNKRHLAVGPKLIELHDKFQLVLCSKTNKLNIEAESYAHLSIMPLTVTAVGLSDQLLSQAIVLKQPELEQQRVSLLKNEGILLKQRIDLEDKLLDELSKAQGDILKNSQLLQTLNEVKASSSQIDESLKQSAQVKTTLMAGYTQLRVLCDKAANFYMALARVYEISGLVFIQLFSRALQSLEGDFKIFMLLVRYTFEYLARATASSNHLTLALYLCRQAFPERLPNIEWELFLTDFMSSNEVQQSSIILPDGLDAETKQKLQVLFAHLPDLQTKLQMHKQNIWSSFMEGKNSHIPGDITNAFHKVLLVQILRPDLMNTVMRSTVVDLLGISINDTAHLSIEQLANEASADKPILLITQAECDPANEIYAVSSKYNNNKNSKKLNYIHFSIGHGLEQRAMETIRHAAEQGNWVCIQNVHLVPKWLTVLERELTTMSKNINFRLWLVCETARGFSESIMHKFIKVLYELPNGIKHKVQRMLENYASSHVLSVGKKPIEDARQLKIRFVMFVLTAVLQERRKFIPQAWSCFYKFGDADLRAVLEIINWTDATLASGRCDWMLMQQLFKHVAFGGRMANERDLNVLQTYLHKFCHADVLSSRWTPLDTDLVIPTSAHIQDYVEAVAKFSADDEPKLYKLTQQTLCSREIDMSKQIMRDLRSTHFSNLEPKATLSGADLKDYHLDATCHKHVKPILNLWSKLSSKCNVIQTAGELKAFDHYAHSPWSMFVVNELKTAAECFKCVHQSLMLVHNYLKEVESQTLSKSLKIRDLLHNLSENRTPVNWQNIWCGPKNAVDYLKALVTRANAANERFVGQLEEEFAQSMDLKSLFHCETFFFTLKLINARKLNISCKDLQLVTQMSDAKQINTQPKTNDALPHMVILAPLKIDGAVFSAGKIVIHNKDGTSYEKQETAIPNIVISYDKKSSSSNRKYGLCKFPLYTDCNRENLICEIDVPTSSTTETVLLSGAALVVQD